MSIANLIALFVRKIICPFLVLNELLYELSLTHPPPVVTTTKDDFSLVFIFNLSEPSSSKRGEG